MKEVVGVKFKNNVRLYYFDPVGIKFSENEFVIVETVRGVELAKVIIPNRMLEDDEIPCDLKPVIRKAYRADIEKQEHFDKITPESFAKFKKEVVKLDLPMKPLYCEYTIDGAKVIFYYSAEDRVDFRELLKVLSTQFKTRIELRQVGERDAARIIGGLGPCGRVICCKSCLSNFDYVTMKMAKEQGLALNTQKISGVCGKLLCCIGYEHDLYQKLKAEMPEVNDVVKTPHSSHAKVVSVDYMKAIVKVKEDLDKDDITVYPAKEVELLYKKPGNPMKEEPMVKSVTKSEDTNKVKQDKQKDNKQVPAEQEQQKNINNNQNVNKNNKNKANDKKKPFAKFKRQDNNGKNN